MSEPKAKTVTNTQRKKGLILKPLTHSFATPAGIFVEFMSQQMGGKGFSRQRALLSQVSSVIEYDNDFSILVMTNGQQVAVNMAYDELNYALYQNTDQKKGAVIDLKALTGSAADHISEVKFNKAVSPQARLQEKSVTIRMMIHGESEVNYSETSFLDQDIKFVEPAAYNSKHGFVQLKSGSHFFCDIDISSLTEKMIEAKQNGLEVLDLRLETSPKSGVSKKLRPTRPPRRR